jgi:3-hydroxyisobutyrate dehydrogenase-like beta-hydroxyacid dehydrogenase
MAHRSGTRNGFDCKRDAKVKIGFVGVGLMGQGMVMRLLAAGHEVTVLAHRNREPIQAVVALGAHEAIEAKAIVQDAQIIFICVDSAETVEKIVASLLPHVMRGQIIVDATTSRPEVSQRLAAELKRKGVAFADAPMTGGPEQVRSGEAGALVGAEPHVFGIVQPVIASYCSLIEHFGPVGHGHMAKLISNYLACGMIALISDSYGLARKAGVDWRKLYDVQLKGSTNSGALRKMVGPALDGNYDGYLFSIANAAKDMGYYCELANSFDHPAQLAQAAHSLLEARKLKGDGKKNVSRMLEEIA